MPKEYNQITADERDKIAVYLAGGFNYSDIARMLGRNRSSIMREINRNGSKQYQVYTSMYADKRSIERKSIANRHTRLKDPFIRDYVHEKIKEQWTPELIAGRLAQDHPGYTISHEAVYQYIYEDAPELKKYLPRSHRVRRKRKAGRAKSVNRIPERVGIDQRPQQANDRAQFGHWEADTAVSRQSLASLAVLAERVSRLTKLKKINRNNAEDFSKAIIDRLDSVVPAKRKTITYDNGKENVNHQSVNASLGTQSFFCNPYHSWEKGSVEQIVGLVRRYLPKKTDFAKVSDDQIEYIEHQLNSRPRKCLNFRTPYEVFSSTRVALHG
jgi:transposase, IS30 family